MGETIRKTAAREDILHDFKKTYANATARGGVPATLAEQRILPVLKILDSIKSQEEVAQAAATPLLAVLTAVTRSAAIELGHFKRMLKANGFTEAEAHTMIPDRSSAPARKEAPTPPATPTSPGPRDG